MPATRNYQLDYYYKNHEAKKAIGRAYHWKNRESILEKKKLRRKLHPEIKTPERIERLKRSRIKWRLKHDLREYKKYGLTKESFKKIEARQGGLCAICGLKPNKSLCIDHNHETGAVRGLLCDKCNRGLGFFKENIESLKSAIEYLKVENI